MFTGDLQPPRVWAYSPSGDTSGQVSEVAIQLSESVSIGVSDVELEGPGHTQIEQLVLVLTMCVSQFVTLEILS